MYKVEIENKIESKIRKLNFVLMILIMKLKGRWGYVCQMLSFPQIKVGINDASEAQIRGH